MNRQEHLLVCLMEECAEVQQIASKILRFGIDNFNSTTKETNKDLLVKEMHDLVAVMDMLADEDMVPAEINTPAVQDKKDKVNKFMNKAIEWGTLSD